MTHSHENLSHCQELLGQLNDYVDGELAAELCHDLEHHLMNCTDCQVVFDTLAKTIKLYHRLDETPMEIPANVEARLMQRLHLPLP